MKAKYFKKLRETSQWYSVEATKYMFGFQYAFEMDMSRSKRVLARNPLEACFRAEKRGLGIRSKIHRFHGHDSTATFGIFRVKKFSDPNHWKCISYYE